MHVAAQISHGMQCKYCLYLLYEFEVEAWSNYSVLDQCQVSQQNVTSVFMSEFRHEVIKSFNYFQVHK